MLGDKVNVDKVVFRQQVGVNLILMKCDEGWSTGDTGRMETQLFLSLPQKQACGRPRISYSSGATIQTPPSCCQRYCHRAQVPEGTTPDDGALEYSFLKLKAAVGVQPQFHWRE